MSILSDWIRPSARDLALRALSIGRKVDGSGGWIRMAYYHHVREDERKGFGRQLDYLHRFGEFLPLDDAVRLLTTSTPMDGRYFTVSFDDGLRSCAAHAAAILVDHNIPATFYVVSEMVGRSLSPSDPIARDVFGHRGAKPLEFMDWNDCRALAAAGMTIGSHTATHTRLAQCSFQQVTAELARSKETIEREVGKPCIHFCAPYGRRGADFDPIRDPDLARKAGYASFATGCRGPNRAGESPYDLKRDHLLANWGLHQLRYFFGS